MSWHREVGTKVRLGDAGNLTLAVFRVDVKDEIVVDTAIGGRTTFRNATVTHRKGAEVGWQGRWRDFEAAVAYTHLNAQFAQPFTSGGATVPAGRRLPGVPATTLYGEVVWRPAASGFHAAVEARHNGRVYVDDVNSESAAPYTTANVRVGLEQRTRQWRFTQFLRLDNVADRQYIGSVIVADGNRRFYEPAPERNWLVGASAELTF